MPTVKRRRIFHGLEADRTLVGALLFGGHFSPPTHPRGGARCAVRKNGVNLSVVVKNFTVTIDREHLLLRVLSLRMNTS